MGTVNSAGFAYAYSNILDVLEVGPLARLLLIWPPLSPVVFPSRSTPEGEGWSFGKGPLS